MSLGFDRKNRTVTSNEDPITDFDAALALQHSNTAKSQVVPPPPAGPSTGAAPGASGPSTPEVGPGGGYMAGDLLT
jgi:hypothetical protein